MWSWEQLSVNEHNDWWYVATSKPRDVQPGHYPLMTGQASRRMVGFLAVVVGGPYNSRDRALTPRKTEPPSGNLAVKLDWQSKLTLTPLQLKKNPCKYPFVTCHMQTFRAGSGWRRCGEIYYLHFAASKRNVLICAKFHLTWFAAWPPRINQSINQCKRFFVTCDFIDLCTHQAFKLY